MKNEVNYDYDYKYDIFTMNVTHDYEYGQSLELDTEVILDLDNNNIPVSLEIIGLSELLGVPKYNLVNVNATMKIICTEDVLKVFITFSYTIHEKEFKNEFNSKIANTYNIPDMETELITV